METMETGNKYCCVIEATHVLGRKLIGLELFRNGSVDEFYRLKALITLEQVNTLVVGKKRRILISKRLTGRML